MKIVVKYDVNSIGFFLDNQSIGIIFIIALRGFSGNSYGPTNNENCNEPIMLESDEVVVVSNSAMLRMPIMRVLCKSTDCEDLRMKIVEDTIKENIQIKESIKKEESPLSVKSSSIEK